MYVQLNKYNVDGLIGQSLKFTLQAPKLNVELALLYIYRLLHQIYYFGCIHILLIKEIYSISQL